MNRWTIDDALDIELTGIRHARLRLVGGTISVVPGDGPAHLVVKDVANGAVEVRSDDGTLTIVQEQPRSRRFIRGSQSPSATVLLSIPADAALDISAVSADVLVAGLRASVSVRTVSGALTFKDI